MNSIVQTYKGIEYRVVSQQEPIADPSLADGSPSKTKRTPMLVTSGPREVLRSGAEPMSDHNSRGQESPDRPTQRLRTDGGTTTYYVATGRHGQHRTFHTDQNCPALDRATGVRTREREHVPEDQLCPRCVGEEYWNQGGNDWSYQKVIAEEAGVDGDIVTDGGTITVCPECDEAAISRRVPDHPMSPDSSTTEWYCLNCQASFDDPIEREPRGPGSRSGLAGELARADPDDLVTDGGEEIVYVAAKSDGSTAVLHTDQSCPHLKRTRKVVEKPRSVYPDDSDLCERCLGDVPETGGDNSGPWERLDAAEPDDLATDGGVPDPDAFRMPTVAELDAMRVAKGLSQRELSRRAGCEQSRFCTILNKDIDPHASTLRTFLAVLQDAEPRADDEIERTGPKPEPSSNADPDPDDFELLSAQLHHSPPDAVGEDPRPPERERDDGLRPDGGRLRSKADANTGRLSVAGVVGWPTTTEEYVDAASLVADDGLPEPDRAEQERRARQTATSLVAWCRRAGLDPGLVLASVREELPRTDGGRSRVWDHEPCPHDDCAGELQQQDDANVMCLRCEDVWGHHKNDEEHYLVSKASNIVAKKPREDETPHFCEICSTEFETIAALITHDCEDRDAPLVTDGHGPAQSVLFDRWMGKASENIEKWGYQREETLILAIHEEAGELAQAFLEARAEGGDPARIDDEIDDLGALLLQLHEVRSSNRGDST